VYFVRLVIGFHLNLNIQYAGPRTGFDTQLLHATIELFASYSSPHPHLQIRHRCPDIALGPFGDLAGDGDGSAPAPGEELRQNVVVR